MVLIRLLCNLRLFEVRLFFRKIVIFTSIYVSLAIVVLWLDTFSFPHIIQSVNAEHLKMNPTTFPGALISPTYGLVLPLYPLGIKDSSMIYVVLITGLLPVLVVVFYTSFRKAWNRWLLSVGIIVFSIALWLNFVVVYGTDVYSNSKMVLIKSRILFWGTEPEKLLIESPEKALRANPDMLKANNTDLKVFIEKNFPDGFP